MDNYRDYASIYDRSGQIAFSLRILPYLRRLRERHPVGGQTLLELACGTGTVALAYGRQGWRVYGVDGSPQMLAQARAKQEDETLDITWIEQDMREVVLPERVHLATCLYDSINYILDSEGLLAVFRHVYRALLPGGAFYFDMNTAWAMAALWDGRTYFTDENDVAVILESQYNVRQQRISVVATCFERVGELYRKIVEEHVEQAYPPEHVATLLQEVGFKVEAQYDCFSFTPPDPTTLRVMHVARRPE
jgi:ubiquinone/menaquinone biosynthesis C-methylase UbiE